MFQKCSGKVLGGENKIFPKSAGHVWDMFWHHHWCMRRGGKFRFVLVDEVSFRHIQKVFVDLTYWGDSGEEYSECLNYFVVVVRRPHNDMCTEQAKSMSCESLWSCKKRSRRERPKERKLKSWTVILTVALQNDDHKCATSKEFIPMRITITILSQKK